MRIEILVFAALAVLANAAPQWPYRDAVAPYYYGYPGKSPYMYKSADEDDENEESYSVARQDLKVATSDGGSTVTVVEDDEKADGIQVVETGSAKPLKPVVQSANNNQQQKDQQQPAAAPQAQQPLSTNNAQQQTTTANGQPLTVQQPGQQPPAFPPARPSNANRPPRPVADEEEEDEESEEDDEDAEDEEDDGDDDDDDEDEEDDEDRRRDAIAQKEASSEEPAQQPAVVQEEEPQAAIPINEGSDEVVQEQPIVVEQPQKLPSQSSVLSNKVKVNKNQPSAAGVAPAAPVAGKKKKKAVAKKVKPSSGAIEALVPGYVTDQGEVLVPVDTVTGSQPITIVPDPFSPPSRIVAGPRPIPQSAVPNTARRQVPFWYRSNPVINPLTHEISPMTRQTLYTDVPPPGSIFTFDDDDDDDDDADDSPSIVPGNRLRQDAEDDDDEEADEDEEDDRKKAVQPPQKVPLASVPAVGNSGEDDEAEALAFINNGRPVPNKKPPTTQSGGSTGNKKPGAGGKPTGQATSNESDSEEEPESEEDDVDSNEDEEDDYAAARAAGASPAQIAANPLNRGRMYVDEELVSFPPSRSPTLFAVIQGQIPGPGSQRRQPQPQIFSTPNPSNPYQRFVVRVTPSNRPPRPPTSSPLYYRPLESGPPPNRRVVPVASFDVSVEDTRPSPSSTAVDSEEDNESVSIGGPTPVTNYPFVYKVQGSVQGLRFPSGGPQSLAALLGGGPSRPPIAYYGASYVSGGPRPRPPRPGPSGGPYGYRPRPPYSFSSSFYGSPYGGPQQGPSGTSISFGPPRPSGGPNRGPPIIVRRKQPGGGPNRPPKPHLIAVYNPTGSSSSGPGPREPVDEEYYTFEVPEHNTKIVPGGGGGPPKNNKRPTVHRKPTPVIHQKFVSEEEEEESEERSPAPAPQRVQIIPHGTVRSRRIRGGKQLKPKKNSKKTVSSSSKKQLQQDQQDPLGLLSKVNKSKTKMH